MQMEHTKQIVKSKSITQCKSQVSVTIVIHTILCDIVMPIYNLVFTAIVIQKHQAVYGSITKMIQIMA